MDLNEECNGNIHICYVCKFGLENCQQHYPMFYEAPLANFRICDKCAKRGQDCATCRTTKLAILPWYQQHPTLCRECCSDCTLQVVCSQHSGGPPITQQPVVRRRRLPPNGFVPVSHGSYIIQNSK